MSALGQQIEARSRQLHLGPNLDKCPTSCSLECNGYISAVLAIQQVRGNLLFFDFTQKRFLLSSEKDKSQFLQQEKAHESRSEKSTLANLASCRTSIDMVHDVFSNWCMNWCCGCSNSGSSFATNNRVAFCKSLHILEPSFLFCKSIFHGSPSSFNHMCLYSMYSEQLLVLLLFPINTLLWEAAPSEHL